MWVLTHSSQLFPKKKCPDNFGNISSIKDSYEKYLKEKCSSKSNKQLPIKEIAN